MIKGYDFSNNWVIRTLYFILFLLFVGKSYPNSYVRAWFGMEGLTYIVFFIAWVMLFFLLKYPSKIKFPEKNFLLVHGFVFVWFVYRLVILKDVGSSTVIINFILAFLALMMTLNSMSSPTFMRYQYRWNYIMLICMAIGMVLFVAGLLPIISIIPRLEGEGEELIVNFGLFFVKAREYQLSYFEEFRPSGWYDEPGSLANVILYLLIYNRLFIKSVKAEVALIIGGCCTTSMAHYIISVVWYFFFYFKLKSSHIMAFFGIFITLIVLYNIDTQDERMQYYKDKVFGRLEKFVNDEEGGSSRDYDSAFDALKKYWLTGALDETLQKEFPSATKDTLWYCMANYGAIGTIIFFSPVWYAFLLQIRKKKITPTQLKIFFILAMCLYQRPSTYAIIYIIYVYYIWYHPSGYYELERSKRLTKVKVI